MIDLLVGRAEKMSGQLRTKAILLEPQALQFGEESMTLSAVSHYRGGTIDQVAPLAAQLKSAYLKHGVAYRLSRFQTGPNVGDWFVVVQYADLSAYANAQAAIAQDPECQQAFAEIATFATRISRELLTDLDL